jgi:hypothetical protein
MAERKGEILSGNIYLEGGQILVPHEGVDLSFIEATGGRRYDAARESLAPLPRLFPPEADRDVRDPEWKPDITKEDMRGF